MSDNIYTLGFDNALTKPPLFSETVQSSNSFSSGAAASSLTSGELTGNLVMADGYMKSGNFVTGTAGWKIDKDGNIEANDGTFRGDITTSSLSYSKLTLQSSFESIDGFTTATVSSAVTLSKFGLLTMITEGLNGANARLYVSQDVFDTYPVFSKNPQFETTLRIDLGTGHSIKFGILDDMETTGGIGFKVSSSTLYALYYDTTGAEHTYELSTVDITGYKLHTYRVEYDYESEIRYYVDNTLLYTLAYDGDAPPNQSSYLVYYYVGTTTGGVGLYVNKFVYQQDL